MGVSLMGVSLHSLLFPWLIADCNVHLKMGKFGHVCHFCTIHNCSVNFINLGRPVWYSSYSYYMTPQCPCAQTFILKDNYIKWKSRRHDIILWKIVTKRFKANMQSFIINIIYTGHYMLVRNNAHLPLLCLEHTIYFWTRATLDA